MESEGLGRAAPVRSWAWWFVPDVALVVSFVTLLYVLFVFDGTRELLRDGDSGWHIRTGEAILAGAGLPRTDTYSLLRSGQPWFAWEWGADVLMGFLHQAGGLAAVTGAFAAVIAACAWLWFRLHWVAGGHFLIAGALIAPFLTTTQIHWHARPHVLSWLFLLGAILYAESGRRNLVVVAVASALWANIHASFFLGTVIALVYASGRFLRPLIWDNEDRGRQWKDARWFCAAAVVSGAATLANPYGWHVHEHVFKYLGNSELLARIGEFHSFNFFAEEAPQILIAVVVAATGAVLAFGQRRLEHAFLIALLLLIGIRSARGLPIVALLGLPLANGAITTALRNATGLRQQVRRRIDGFLTYGANLRKFDRRFAGPVFAIAVLLLLVAGLRLPAVAQRAGYPEREFPVTASAAVDKLPLTARLLAPDSYGGYLIYRFNGKRKVYFDGRSDFYGTQYMKDYLDLVEVRAGWRDQVEKIGFDNAILPKRYSLVPALEAIGWKRLHADDVAVLLQAPPRNAGSAKTTEKQ